MRERRWGHGGVMGGRVGGCLVLFPGVCCPKFPHDSLTLPSDPTTHSPGPSSGTRRPRSSRPTPAEPPNDLSKTANIADVVFATSPRNCCPGRRVLAKITTFRGIRRGFRTKAVGRRGRSRETEGVRLEKQRPKNCVWAGLRFRGQPSRRHGQTSRGRQGERLGG